VDLIALTVFFGVVSSESRL